MTGFSIRMKIGLLLGLIVLFVLAFTVFGCTAWHVQATGGTGKEGVAAATAMAAGDPHPAAPGSTISSESKKSVSRAARD